MDTSRSDAETLYQVIKFGTKNEILEVFQKNRDTVLHLLIQNESLIDNDVIELFKAYSGLPDESSYYSLTLLQAAIESDKTSLVEILVDHGMNNSDKNEAALTLFSRLLEISNWRNKKNARAKHFFNILKIVVDKGIDINAKKKSGETPLYYAVNFNSLPAIKFLNEHCANFDMILDDDSNLFHLIADKHLDPLTANEFEEMYRLILSKGCCDVNRRDKCGHTPLHFACLYNNYRMIRLLLEDGAEVNCKNKDDLTPLHFILDENEDVVKMLLQSGLNLNGSEDVVKMLLQSGADVNAKDYYGIRPLYDAATISDQHRQLAIVKMLLENGAYVNESDKWHSPFAEFIRKRYFFIITDKLLIHGADINDRRVIAQVNQFERLNVELEDDLEYLFHPMELKAGIEDRRFGLDRFARRYVFQHWIKLEAAGLPCSKEYEPFVKSNIFLDAYQRYHKQCLIEVEKLKSTLIKKRTSLYDFLHMDFGCKRSHIDSDKIRNLVNSQDYEDEFPYYYPLIFASYRETNMWRKLLEPAKQAWHQLIKVALPDECIEMVLARLRIEDLVSMTDQ